MEKINIIITRHPGLLEVLKELGIATPGTPVVVHATAALLAGKHVAGVLPLSLAALCASVTEVALNLPADLRGKELNADEVRAYMTGVKTYRVEELPPLPEGEVVREFREWQGNRDRACKYGVVHDGKFYTRHEAEKGRLARFANINRVREGRWSYTLWRVATKTAKLVVTMAPVDGWSDDISVCVKHIRVNNPALNFAEAEVAFRALYPAQAAKIDKREGIKLI